MSWIRTYNLYLAWIVAMVAMGGSLYFSEVMKFIPCTYCWYQRICMYPLALLLGIAAFKKDHGVTKYVLPMAIIGMCFSTVHYLKQKTDLFPAACSSVIPCSGQYINWLGFITIPFLALTAFVLIIGLMSLKKSN